MKKDFQNRKVLVTGGTGLIGSEVTSQLLELGSKVKVVSLDNLQNNKDVEFINGDLTDLSLCLKVTRDVDYVFHLAGIKGSIDVTKSRPASFFVPLLMFNTNVLEASRRNNVEKLVYTSSIGAYSAAEVFVETENRDDAPQDMYPGWAKRMAELQIRAYKEQYDLDWSIVRPCNVYGPGDNFDPKNAMVIPSLMHRIANGEKPLKVWGDGTAIRDFAFSRDVALGVIQALHYGTRGDFVNLGSGEGYSVKQLVDTLKEFIDFEYEFDPSKPSGFPKRVMDISRAKEWINYNPKTSLREGLELTWNWFMNNRDEYLKRQNYFA
jgi:GDP-L-fucose synthase